MKQNFLLLDDVNKSQIGRPFTRCSENQELERI